METFIWFPRGMRMSDSKKYSFWESDPTLQRILDELTRNRQLTQTMHNLLINGLGKDISKTQKQLKQRLESMSKVKRLYKKLQTQQKDKFDQVYLKYKKYRNGLVEGNIEYDHGQGLEWIDKQAKNIGIEKSPLLAELEERYKGEKNECKTKETSL